ncbi:MAG: peptidylprolyl isomerase [Luteolibacter sp.]|jgi:parvulin-like peptidyl-prolyl isomerase|nr:peptidylprolyl isomerase [Luteolibacter sp.]
MKPLLLTLVLSTALHADSVLGKIGDIEIQTDEIRETIAGLESAQDLSLASDPAALGQYVRALLIQRLVLKQALAKNWDKEPAVINKLVRARESTITESYLESVSKVPESFPSDAELQTAYDAAKPSLLVPKSYHIAQIFIAKAEGKTKLDSVLAKLKSKDADFAAIARAHSDEADSKSRGGEIGWLTEAQLQPGIREALPKLSVGKTSETIELDGGWHILKLLETKAARTPTLDEIRPQLVTQLRAERARLNRQEFLAQLLKENPLAINEIEIGKIAKP